MPRWFEILFASGCLLVLLPFFLIIALLIIIDSAGPIFFRQSRIGKNGKSYEIIKFRKMHIDATSHGAAVTQKNDPRLTRVGRWLERFKLDETPQFINVLLGHMSIVGPRPEVEHYVEFYPEKWKTIHTLRPGVVGYAQTRYPFESDLYPEDCEDPVRFYIQYILPEKLDLEIEYVQRRGFWFDWGVILQIVQKYWVKLPHNIKTCRAQAPRQVESLEGRLSHAGE